MHKSHQVQSLLTAKMGSVKLLPDLHCGRFNALLQIAKMSDPKIYGSIDCWRVLTCKGEYIAAQGPSWGACEPVQSAYNFTKSDLQTCDIFLSQDSQIQEHDDPELQKCSIK